MSTGIRERLARIVAKRRGGSYANAYDYWVADDVLRDPQIRTALERQREGRAGILNLLSTVRDACKIADPAMLEQTVTVLDAYLAAQDTSPQGER